MVINTSDTKSIKSFIKKLQLPAADSHKGQNGRVLVIGGSSLFHSASIWAAEVASHFVDIVHYSSTKENNEVMLSLKKKFHSGIVVPQSDLMNYVVEDDVVLVGPGMMREGEEGRHTQELTKSLIENFPDKRFVFDAGALQMMKPEWLLKLKTKPILTPHAGEYEGLFGNLTPQEAAKKYHAVILLKKIDDFVYDGKEEIVIKGGNPGLTKGGTGDLLAGLCLAFYAKSDPVTAAAISSYLLKRTADELSKDRGYWYNVDDIIDAIPKELHKL